MLDFTLKAQLAITIAERSSKLRFQPGKAFDLLAHIRQFAFKHGLRFGTGMMFLSQCQQFFNFIEPEPQFLSMPHKFAVMNLLSVEQPIPARDASNTPVKSNILIEANHIHA